MRRKSLAILVVCLVIIMNFFMIAQNQYIPPDSNFTENNAGIMPDDLPVLDELPPLGTSAQEPYPKEPSDIESQEDIYLSNYYYRYKEFVFDNINNSFDFIFRNLLNSSEGSFYEYVYLNGSQNNTRKYTLTNALMVINLVDVYLSNKSLNYLQMANQTMDFLLNNCYFNVSTGGLTGFINYYDNETYYSNETYSSDNAMAILALLKLYEVTENITLLEIANQTLTYMNEELWDSEYYGYFKSNDTNDLSKYTIDNLISILMNLEVYRTYEYDYEYQINALRKSETIMSKILEDFDISNSLVLNYSRNWSIKNFGNQSHVNSLGIISLLELSQSTLNETYVRIAENISNFLWNNFYDTGLQGLNHSITDTTKYLETNSWAMQAFLKLYEKTNNITYYLQGRNISYFLNNHLWDVNNKIYNYSMDSGASAQNSTKKSTRANSIAILGLLEFRFPDIYLTRANTTMRLLLEHIRPEDIGFYTSLSRDHDQYQGSEYETVIDNFLAMLTLFELGAETNLTNYIYNNSIEIYNRINSTFYNSTFNNSTESYYYIGTDKNGDLINSSSLIENTYALLALSELYKITNDTIYLQEINKTWHYINNTLWYNATGGYYNKSSPFNNQINRYTFDHFLTILANLEVANISSIYPSLQGNATKMANITLQLINNNTWDNDSWGFYTSANESWGISSDHQNRIDAKRLDSNSLSILVHSRYLELFPEDIYNSTYYDRINKTLIFIQNSLWDNDLGGFFDYSNHNGTIIGLNKSTSDNSLAILAYSKLFEDTNNYTYYAKSEEILNFVNLYLWDYETGGYFTGYYKQEVAIRQLKTLFSEFMAIRALIAVSQSQDKLSLSPLINIKVNNSKLNSLGRYFDANLVVYDTDGNKLENADVMIFLSGFVDNTGLSPIFGLGQKFNFTSKNSNIYNFNLDFSPYYAKIFINPLILNESYSASWNLILSNRTFSIYESRLFTTLSSLTLGFYDSLNSGFYNFNGTNLNKSAEENFYAIYTILDYINSTGLNIAIDWSKIAIDQILLNFSLNSTDFLINNFLIGNVTSLGFISETDVNGTHISNLTLCKDNAWAIITFLKLYDITNDTGYLEVANATWKYLNSTFWDSVNGGYNTTNSTTENTKNLYDNLLAILANLGIASYDQINQTIRTQALNLANYTLNETIDKLWDSINYGFYSRFNYTWQPLHEINEKSTLINSLAILTMLEYLRQYPNDVNNNTYYAKMNQTSDFMMNYLWDSRFLGFYSYYNNSIGINNTNKTLKDNSFAILAFSELFDYTNNYTHYINAEKASFFINTYFWSPDFLAGAYVNKSSSYGFINPVSEVDLYSSLSICRALTKLYSLRLDLKNPLAIGNFSVEQKIEGKIEDLYDLEIEILDGTGNPIQNATAFVIVYGMDQIFNFSNLNNNRYVATINISQLNFLIQINILIFNESNFAAGFYTLNYYREFPNYIQIAHNTLNVLRTENWDDITYADGFRYSILGDTSKNSYDNFLMLDAIYSLNQTTGKLKYSMDWYGNDTYDILIDRIYKFLNTTLRANQTVYINSTNTNVTGYIRSSDQNLQNPVNITRLKDNSIAVITLLDLYNQTGNTEYLKRANETWLYLNATFWDVNNSGYMPTNETSLNLTRDISANFLAILAALQINQTIEINSTIRDSAFRMAYETFYLINTTKEVWDTNVSNEGGYFEAVNITSSGYWNLTNNYKTTTVNSLGILCLLKFYEITGNSVYMNQSLRIVDLMFKYLWDKNNTGFYEFMFANWSIPNVEKAQLKWASPNAWALLAFCELFRITSNSTPNLPILRQTEKIMAYLNTFVLNFQFEDDFFYFLAFKEVMNLTNHPIYGSAFACDSNALIIKGLVKFFNLVNSTFWNTSTSPWLTDNINYIPGTDPPNGEILNVTLSIKYNLTDDLNDANVTLYIFGYDTRIVQGNPLTQQVFRYIVNATFNSSGNNLYIGKFINISKADDVYFCIFGINASGPAIWNIHNVKRLETSLDYQLLGFPTSPIAIKNKRVLPDVVIHEDNHYRWKEFILGQDRITINVTYGGSEFVLGKTTTPIPNARVNFEVLNPDGSLYVNRTFITTKNGIATISFGPTKNIDEAIGIYNVTITAAGGPSNTELETWYASTVTKMYIQVGYGIYIAYIDSLTDDVAQGDYLQCNLTLKNDRKEAAVVNITAHGDIFITNSSLINYLVDVGYTEQIVLVKLDERTIPKEDYKLITNLFFQDKYISNETLLVDVKNSTDPARMGIPTQIAEGDLRYAIIKVKNQKLLVDLNFTLELFLPEALDYVEMNETLSPNAESYFYIPLSVKNLVPYGEYSGNIKVSWVNYSIDYYFSIKVTPDLGIGTIVTPVALYQDQTTLLTVEIDNYRSTPVRVVVGVFGTGGFQPMLISSHIDAFASKVMAIPCLFKTLPWDIGLKYLHIQVYLFSDNGLELKYSRLYITEVIMSIPNILLLYILPFISIILIMVLLLNRVRKIKEVEKKKLVSEQPVKKKEEDKDKRKKAPSVF